VDFLIELPVRGGSQPGLSFHTNRHFDGFRAILIASSVSRQSLVVSESFYWQSKLVEMCDRIKHLRFNHRE